MKTSTVVTVLLAGLLSLTSACGGKKEEKGAAAPAAGAAQVAAEPTPEGPVGADPVTVDAKTLKPGLKLTVFGNNKFTEPVTSTGIVSETDFDCDKNAYNGKEVSFREEGYLKVEKDGAYCVQLFSDDESRILVNGKPLVVNARSTSTKERILNLKAGYYDFKLEYQNNVGPGCLKVRWAPETCGSAVPIPASAFSH
jgi:hypothetical protein